MDADDTIAPSLNPEMARVYRNYLLTCRRLGVPAAPRERADKLIAEWVAAIQAARATKH